MITTSRNYLNNLVVPALWQVSVDVMEFPPLPPSPVEEADEESSDIGSVMPPKSKSHGSSNRTIEYRPRVPPHRTPVGDSKEQASLNTRSMDAGFARGRRAPAANNSRREVSPHVEISDSTLER